ncbi:MAG: diguanylate cyclase [Armatimonadetes bacterium]|nr:diguanylate cyclase [Armatimonadota bacterium]
MSIENRSQLTPRMGQSAATVQLVDDLTKCYKETFLEFGVSQVFEQSKRYDRTISCLAIEIWVSHEEMRYAAMKRLGKIVRDQIRNVDTPVRSGNKILIFLPETEIEGAKTVAEKVKSSVENYAFAEDTIPEGGKMSTVSGIAAFPAHADSLEKLMQAAKWALEGAWNQESRIQVFEGKMT